MRKFWKLFLTELKLFLREPIAFFFTLIFPVLLLILFGLIFGNEPDPDYFGGNYGYIDTEVPALIAIVIASGGFMGIPIDIVTAREKKILYRYRSTPLHPFIFLMSKIISYFLTTLISMVILILIGKLLFNLRFGGSWTSVLFGFTLASLSFFSVGYLIASLAPTSRTALVVGQIAFFPMMFLSGAAFPLEMLPETLRKISNFLPMTHVVKFLQGLWFGQSWRENLTEVIVLIVMFVIGTVISVRTFRWE